MAGRVAWAIGLALAIALGASMTLLTVLFLRWVATLGAWLFLVPVVIADVAGWIGILAWKSRRWDIAAPSFLGTLLFPWGYIIEIAGLAVLLLAGAAAVALARERSSRGRRAIAERLETASLVVGFIGAAGLAQVSMFAGAPWSIALFFGMALVLGVVLALRLSGS